MKYFAGIDEAGRGPVLGPMVMAIVACTPADKQFFNKIGVKDSKLLTAAKRTKLARVIKSRCEYAIIKATPEKIDTALRSDSSSLNFLEADLSKKLINKIIKKLQEKNIPLKNLQQTMLDLPAKNKEEYLKRVQKNMSQENKSVPLKAEFKADLNYVEVSAASILAKTTRDASMKTLSKKLNLKLGSGYPADPNTQKILQTHFKEIKKEGNIMRTEWKTIKNIIEEKNQTTLSKF